MPKRDRAADVTKAKRVREPRTFTIKGHAIAWCDEYTDSRGRRVTIYGNWPRFNARDARRLAAWLARAAAWIDQQEPKHG